MQFTIRAAPRRSPDPGPRLGHEAEIDVSLHATEPETTLGQLIEAAGLASPLGVVDVDGRPHRTDDRLAAAGLHQGTVIGPPAPPGKPLARVTRVAGDHAGRSLTLGVGVHDVGRSDATTGHRLDTPCFRITVEADGTTTLLPLQPEARVLDETTVDCGTAVYRVERIPPEAERPQAPPAGGRVAFARSPRLDPPPTTVSLAGPIPPAPPKPPQPLSWILLLAPIPFGIVMAYFFSPFFLAFTLMSPIMSLARWWDGRRQLRKGRARVERETAERRAEFGAELAAAADREAADRRMRMVDLDQLRRQATDGNGRLWEVRPRHRDFLTVCAGLAEVPWFPEIENRTLPGLNQIVTEQGALPTAPAELDLTVMRGVGVVGQPRAARRVAAALVTQLVTRHGPADVELGCVLGPNTTPRWDWLKWLPHLLDETGRPRLARSPAEQAAMLPPLPATGYGRRAEPEDPQPVRVIVIDDRAQVATGLPEVAATVNAGRAVAIVVAERAESLPSFCRAIVELRPDHRARVVDMATAEVVDEVVPLVSDDEVVRATARALARFADPEATRSASLLPASCHLGQLLSEPLTADGIQRAWAIAPGGLQATLGLCEGGPFVIDFVRDGPHALVAGTTGSGKSELLRTLITSMAFDYDPSTVNFVLVDFKGGGAFDACADLPHTVGVVTDLDEHLAERALRCLRAELKYRERFLRAAGVSDLRDLPAGPSGLPRLVIVVDEFATLAAELPDFMTSLVDVAQRGRSLGIHMVLATQRPTGVVDAKIRANTNLRIALRVQDDGDSTDVVGTKDAASIHRDQAGRAFARLGADELLAFQTAIVSLPRPNRSRGTINVSPFTLAPDESTTDNDPDPATTSHPDPATADEPEGQPEIELLTEAARAAASARGQAEPRVPWPPALPDVVDLADLGPDRGQPWTATIGMVDLPDEQRQDELRWSAADDGNVLLFGVEPEATDGAVVTLCTALAAGHEPDRLHLYAADFSGGLAPFDDLPHLGTRIGPTDDELLARLLDLLTEELEARRQLQRELRVARLGPEDVALLVLAITNYAGLLEQLDEQRDVEGPGRLAALIRDGGSLGMHVFATGLGERGIPMRIAAQVPTKYVMRLADPLAYTTFGLRGNDVPDLHGGRAVDARTKTEVHFATVQRRVRVRTAGQPGARRLRPLDTEIDYAGLIGRSGSDGDRWRLAIGIGHRDLAPVELELRTGIHAVIAGPPGSGRTSALRTIAAAAADGLPDVPIHTVGLTGVGQPIMGGQELFDLGGDVNLVLVDDVEVIDPNLNAALEQLAANPRSQARLVVAGRPDVFKGVQPLARALTVGRTGLLLQPAPDAGDVFRIRLRIDGVQPEGRGYLLNGGQATLAQVALPPPLEREPMVGSGAYPGQSGRVG